MSSTNEEIQSICNTVHTIMQCATKELLIPAEKEARVVRKKISVFTYGLIAGLSMSDKDKVFKQYLVMGGLNTEQAEIIVNRTRDEFAKREFGEKCLRTGKDVAVKWLSGDKNIQSLVEEML